MSNEINHAAAAVLREALDNVSVHPCDFSNDEVRAKGLYGPMAQLYQALFHPSSANGAEGLPEDALNSQYFGKLLSRLVEFGFEGGHDENLIAWIRTYTRAAVLAERAACAETALNHSFGSAIATAIRARK